MKRITLIFAALSILVCTPSTVSSAQPGHPAGYRKEIRKEMKKDAHELDKEIKHDAKVTKKHLKREAKRVKKQVKNEAKRAKKGFKKFGRSVDRAF